MMRHRALPIIISCAVWLTGGSTQGAPVFTLDFETEDDFATPLVHGQSISSFPRANRVNPFVPFTADTHLEFGRLVNISSTIIGSDGHLDAAIFDSDPADTTSTNDPNLLVGLGNLLMLQSDERPQNSLDAAHGLMFDDPNDEASHTDRGSILFDFLVPAVHPSSIDLVDIDRGVHMELILTDHEGRQRMYAVPMDWTTDIRTAPKGYHTLSLETLLPQPAEPNASGGDAVASEQAGFNDLQVARLEVRILGSSPSAGIDNLVFEIPEPSGLLLALLGASAAGFRLRSRRYLCSRRLAVAVDA